jgi:hypothetical protein
VVKDGKLAWTGAYGFSDLENFVPAKTSTMYRLASISKPITATAILQLVQAGKIDLAAPAQQYCPAYPRKGRPLRRVNCLATWQACGIIKILRNSTARATTPRRSMRWTFSNPTPLTLSQEANSMIRHRVSHPGMRSRRRIWRGLYGLLAAKYFSARRHGAHTRG